MGMSASQVRLMGLTTRMHDLEYKSENIANIKLRLADESDKIAQKYTEALNQSRYTFTTYSAPGHEGQAYTVVLDGNSLMDCGGSQGIAYTSGGYRMLKVDHNNNTDGHGTWIDPRGLSAADVYSMLESGEYKLVCKASGAWHDVTASSCTNIGIESADSATLAKAEAEYNAATAKISRKEKELDRQMTKLDTEHEALKTERDSLKEIIQENVDNTFKLFG